MRMKGAVGGHGSRCGDPAGSTLALQSAQILKSRNPNSVVRLKDLESREEIVIAFKVAQTITECSRCRSDRSPDWLKFKNPEAPVVKREAEEDWGR